ncbi:hypothetical protein [Microbacterium sp. 18062]|uniref:hypothetical protein n=1 Tax=Microbacterium sp. 18062 TaxID=2681410 RepID=UPI00135953E6|nr:hypothetical protein [Microbacterium sp. 18062]
MTTPGDPTAVPDDDVLARLDRLRRKAESTVTDLGRIQDRLTELVTFPEPTAVTAKVDEDARLVGLTIDPVAREALDGERLGEEISIAVGRAIEKRPVRDAADLRAKSEASGIDVQALVAQVLEGRSGLPDEPPRLRWNDQRTVGMAMAAGMIVELRCDPDWLERSSEAVIETEVLAAAEAARAHEDIDAGED